MFWKLSNTKTHTHAPLLHGNLRVNGGKWTWKFAITQNNWWTGVSGAPFLHFKLNINFDISLSPPPHRLLPAFPPSLASLPRLSEEGKRCANEKTALICFPPVHLVIIAACSNHSCVWMKPWHTEGPRDVRSACVVRACVYVMGGGVTEKGSMWLVKEEHLCYCVCVCAYTCLYLCVLLAAGWWAKRTKSTLSPAHCFT